MLRPTVTLLATGANLGCPDHICLVLVGKTQRIAIVLHQLLLQLLDILPSYLLRRAAISNSQDRRDTRRLPAHHANAHHSREGKCRLRCADTPARHHRVVRVPADTAPVGDDVAAPKIADFGTVAVQILDSSWHMDIHGPATVGHHVPKGMVGLDVISI